MTKTTSLVFHAPSHQKFSRSIQVNPPRRSGPALLLRLTGCPMRCVWCDSEYAFTGGESIALEDVIEQVRAFDCKLVEGHWRRSRWPNARRLPDRNNCVPEGYEVLVETGVTFQLKG